MKSCYWCGVDGAFETHVPPKCMFPEKDEFEIDFKNNLDSIPSCEKHVIDEEKDFSYFRQVVRSVKWNNVFSDFKTNSKDKIYDFSIKNCNVDLKELNLSLSLIVKGLYYMKFNKPFHGRISLVVFGFLESEFQLISLLRMSFAGATEEYPKIGKFPQIFFVQWAPAKEVFSRSVLGKHFQSDGLLLRISFYEGTDFYLVLER
jgi:hypothetical protein